MIVLINLLKKGKEINNSKSLEDKAPQPPSEKGEHVVAPDKPSYCFLYCVGKSII